MSIKGSNGSYVTSFLVHSSNDNTKWMVYKDKTSRKPKVITNHNTAYSPMSLFSTVSEQFHNTMNSRFVSVEILISFVIRRFNFS